MSKGKIFQKAVKDTMPILAGYIFLGIGFGILLRAKGLGLGYAILMSITMYAGSMQYAAVTLLSSHASFITIALTTLMVNCRHLFYGISMIDRYKGMGVVKPYLMFSLTDETYSLVVTSGEITDYKERKKYYSLVSVLDHLYWITGCALGSILGSAIKFSTEGIDFTLTALFVTIFIEQWCNNKNHISALSGVIISVICLLIFGEELFLIPSMIAIMAFLLIIRKKEEPKYV